MTGPHNVLGIEINEYASELARITIWIGELQWRSQHGYPWIRKAWADDVRPTRNVE